MTRKQDVAAGKQPKPMKWNEALRFLVTLANSDVQELAAIDNPGIVSTLLYDLRRYLNISGEGELARTIVRAEKGELAVLERPIKEARNLLDNVTAGRFDKCRFDLGKQPPLRIALLLDDESIVMAEDGDLTDVIMSAAYSDMECDDRKLLHVGRCQYVAGREYLPGRKYVDGHEHPKFFYKIKFNQNYCDHACANKAAAERSRPKKTKTARRPAPRTHGKEHDDGR